MLQYRILHCTIFNILEFDLKVEMARFGLGLELGFEMVGLGLGLAEIMVDAWTQARTCALVEGSDLDLELFRLDLDLESLMLDLLQAWLYNLINK